MCPFPPSKAISRNSQEKTFGFSTPIHLSFGMIALLIYLHDKQNLNLKDILMIKNETYKGFSTFLRALRKHITAGTFGGFWTEINGKKTALIANKYTVAGEAKRYVYMYELVDALIENMENVSDEELRDVIDNVLRYSYLFESKYHFLMEVKTGDVVEAIDATIVVEEATPTNEAPEQEPVVFSTESSDSSEDGAVELFKLTIPELRIIYEKLANKKPAMAMKEPKLVEKILEMRKAAK